MKNKIILFFIFLLPVLANAQSWQPVGNGVDGTVNTLFVYDSVMYAGGSFTSPGNNIAQWNGSSWDSLRSGTNNEVYSIANYKGLVYIGGLFTKVAGHSAGNVATWDGTNLEGFNLDEHEGVPSLHVYDSLLYIASDAYGGIALWDGKIIRPFNYGAGNYILSMTIYNNTLCFGQLDWFQEVTAWNNVILSNLGKAFVGNNPWSNGIYALTVYKGKLVAGGNFNEVNLKNKAENLAVWGDSLWKTGQLRANGTVYALTTYNNMLIAGGDFDSAGGVPVNNIAAWNGTSWSAFGNGFNGPIYTLAIFDSNLYAGGDFSSPGNGIVEYISSPGAVQIINNDSVNVFPNPNAGTFTVVCNRVITIASQPVIEIYNILGEKIYSANLLDGNTVISLGKQAPGIYIYKISTPDGTLINPGKLVIE
ncbi:MAG TPA: T9SS type A sorting domain-containing protein [Bacteroidia bacterium]|nr:T9SS type A sorting domain-containing protein [Bacteroidia bacterium]